MPSDSKFRVFVSSTSDLAVERRAIADALPSRFEAYLYEDDRPRGKSPKERLEEVLASSEVFVGLLGRRFGSCYPGVESSIVDWEWQVAIQRDPPLERMGFIAQSLDLTAVEPPQKELIERLRSFDQGHWLASYASLADLTGRLNDSLVSWLVDYVELLKNKSRLRSLWDRLVFGVLALGIAMLGAVALIPSLRGSVSPALIAGFAILVIVLALAGLAFRSTLPGRDS